MTDTEIIEAYKEIVNNQSELIETLRGLVSTLAHELTMATIGKGEVK